MEKMKKAGILMLVCMAFAVAEAKPVSQADAWQAARSFWTGTLGMRDATALQPVSWTYDAAVHLFAADGQGWVMVAADDVARPILAYSTGSALDPSQLPVATQNFLYVYQQEMAAHSQMSGRHAEWDILLGSGSLKDSEEETVGPLLTTTWYQMSPYNMLCPSGCMTGCEATAMAQVLKYWNYPAFGEGTHSYGDAGGHGVQSADFANTRYDWTNMPNRLTSASSAAQKTAVATLMYHCGVSVDMSYSTSLSGAVMTSLTPSLTSYFRYNDRARLVAKGNMSNADWTDTLIAELRHQRPIIYGGEGPAGGHVFVCDGFDTRGYLHFNLGEDGDGDGYYQVGAITYGMYSFNQANDCVLGLEPEYGVYFNTPQLDYGRAAAAQQVWICPSDTCAAAPTVAVSDNWITVTGDISRLGQVTVSVAENNTGSERRGTVTLSQGVHSATLVVLQAAYDPATDYCPLTVEMTNSRNEPWAGDAHLSFESLSGLVYGTAAHTQNGGSSTAQVMVAPHDVMVRWHGGDGRDRYIGYRVTNQYGEVLIEVDNAFFDGADVLLSWPCAHVGIDVAADEQGRVLCTEVYDLAGHLLMTSGDYASLRPGVYLVRTIGEDGVKVKKIVKI